MNLLAMFSRRHRPIRDRKALADFIDENAAFLVQKAIYEYSRARAGHYSKVLFAEPEFRQAVEKSRWQAYPLGLAMVAEVVDSVLRPHMAGDQQREIDALREIVLAVFDRYAVPEVLGAAPWAELRAELERRVQLIGLHPPKRAIDIPAPYAQLYFDLMPIHEKLRGRDDVTTHNYLKVTLANIHAELTRRIDLRAASALLGEQTSAAEAGTG